MEETKIGEITHFFSKISVGVIKLSSELKAGDTIHVKGATTDFEQGVDSIQIEHKEIETASPGDDIGIKLKEPAREGDSVFKVIG
ncbi:translation elongation factor-like protein [Candidatus Woesearchaeota archaeon]|nr:translation elongation factor-like protein [Candidatus Woesearchaeota archaeon]